MLSATLTTARDPRQQAENDPVVRTRNTLLSTDPERLDLLEAEVKTQIDQALAAVRLLIGAGSPLAGRFLVFDGLRLRWHELRVARRGGCVTCAPGRG